MLALHLSLFTFHYLDDVRVNDFRFPGTINNMQDIRSFVVVKQRASLQLISGQTRLDSACIIVSPVV